MLSHRGEVKFGTTRWVRKESKRQRSGVVEVRGWLWDKRTSTKRQLWLHFCRSLTKKAEARCRTVNPKWPILEHLIQQLSNSKGGCCACNNSAEDALFLSATETSIYPPVPGPQKMLQPRKTSQQFLNVLKNSHPTTWVICPLLSRTNNQGKRRLAHCVKQVPSHNNDSLEWCVPSPSAFEWRGVVSNGQRCSQ